MQCYALFMQVAEFEKIQGFTKLRNKKKNESNTLDRDDVTNEKQFAKRNHTL